MIQKIFWKSYFKIYDSLCRARSYRSSIEMGVDLLAPAKGKRYLDLACGTGNSSFAIWDRGVEVVGMDNSETGLKIASRRFPMISFVFGDFNQPFPFRSDSFAGVFAHNAMYLARDPLFTLLEVYRVLEPGGRFVMSNPKAGASPFAIFKREITLEYRENFDKHQDALWARILTIPYTVETFVLFLSFFPFQIALKLGGGGSANFWNEQQWGEIIKQSSFRTVRVEPSYADQNLVFLLQKE